MGRHKVGALSVLTRPPLRPGPKSPWGLLAVVTFAVAFVQLTACDATERNADRIDVTYDPSTGVPIDFLIDYEENTADDELGVRVTEAVSPPLLR